MSSNNNPSDANDETNDDDGLRANTSNDSYGIASNSVTPLDTQTHHINTTSSASATPSTSNPTSNASNPVEPIHANNPVPSMTASAAPTAPRSRWSQTVGTTIFSFDPNTRRLIPIAGTIPITTWAPPGPAGMASPFDNTSNDGMAGAGAGSGVAAGAGMGPGGNPFGMDFGDEGHMSTHLSFSTADGRPIPLELMHHILHGLNLPHAAAATLNPQDPQPQGLGPQGPPAPAASSSFPDPVSSLPGRRRERIPRRTSFDQASTSTSNNNGNNNPASTSSAINPAQIFEETLTDAQRYQEMQAGTSTTAADGTPMDQPNFFHMPADEPTGLSRFPTATGGVQRLARPSQPSLQSAQAAQELANQQRERRRERREIRQRQVEWERERQGRRASSVPPPSTSAGAGPSDPGITSTGGTEGFLGLHPQEDRDFWPPRVPTDDELDASIATLQANATNARQELRDLLSQPPRPPPPGMGWTAPVAGPDGQMTTRFIGPLPGMGGMPLPPGAMPPGVVWGTGMPMQTGPFGLPFGLMGMAPPGMEVERPPDTRRAKELLRGLTIVPTGLVRRMERVEKMLGEEASTESGRLVCAVCYDPLLVASDPPKQVHENSEIDGPQKVEEKEAATMEVDEDDADEISDTKPTQAGEDAAAKPKKAPPKPKHPSLDPTALIALPCTHVFHAVDCLLPWFEQGKTTCPTCRFDVDPRSETLNVARWLGGWRRRAAAANNAQRPGQADAEGNTNEGNAHANVQADGSAPPPAGVAPEEDTSMDAEEDDDETDAFTGEEEVLPGELDPGTLFREAIGRAVASAISQALMNPNPTPPQQQTPQAGNAPNLNPPAHPGQQENTTVDVIMLDAGSPQLPGEQPSDLRYPSAENIELPGANRDQFGRMLRDDGESSIAATNNSTPQTVNADLELSPTMERTQSHRQRGTRAQAPSPSPHVSPPPQQSTSGLRASLAPTLDRFDRFWPPRESHAQNNAPTAGSSSSAQAQAPPTSRPETPRHHPYAHHSRPATNARPTPTTTPAPPGPGPTENTPAPWNPTADNPTPGAAGGASTIPFAHEHNGGRFSITRHSITFNLALPLPGLFGPPPQPPAAGPVNGANLAPQQQQQQQQPNPGANPVPDFLNNIFSRANLFGAPAGSTTRERPSNRPRKKWVAPEGTSLRSVIESKERQVGLRCDDVSCLWGPEDGDEEALEVKIHPDRTYLRKTVNDANASCVHRYHPDCLLVASRIAEAGLDREIDDVGGGEWLEVGCPFCRVHGGQEKGEWKKYRELADVV